METFNRGTDPRVHLDDDGKLSLAEELIALGRKKMQDGSNGPACRQCLGEVLLGSYMLLIAEVLKSDHQGEKIDLAQTSHDFAQILEETSQQLTLAAVMDMIEPNLAMRLKPHFTVQ